MFSPLRYLAWCCGYLLRTKLFRRELPFVGVLVLNESCNLNCLQCRIADRGFADLTFEEAMACLDELRSKGIRSLAITGGEPFHWIDGAYRLEDVVKAARLKGFLAVTVYTNGTYAIETSADAILVGLDGLEKTTKRLRGDVYKTVMGNIHRSIHKRILINFTVNAVNVGEIVQFLEHTRHERNIRGVFFFFHTPYYGIDNLFLSMNQRKEIAMSLIDLKHKGYPILNSVSALKSYILDRWPRPSKCCYTFAHNEMFPCCPEYGNEEVCNECGYLSCLEVIEILRLSPSAILAGFNYLRGSSGVEKTC